MAGSFNNRTVVGIMEAARIVGVSRRTIYNWLRKGMIEHCRTAGGSIRIYEDTLYKRWDHGIGAKDIYPALQSTRGFKGK